MSGETSVSPRVERAQSLSDRLRRGQSVPAAEIAAMLTEMADDYHRNLLVRTLLAVRGLARAGRPHAEIVELIDEALK